MTNRRLGTLALVGLGVATLAMVLGVWALRQERGANGTKKATVVLEGGVRLERTSRACTPGEVEARMPRDADGALRAARGEELDAILGSVVKPGCALQLADHNGELRAFVRARARRALQPGRPLLLVGWDGADPRVIEDLLAAGRLEALGRLRAGGAHGVLMSRAPYLSPLLWTSVATGKRPEEHGILDFVEAGSDGESQPIGAGCRRSTTLWDIASDLGKRVLVVNWWATAPEAPVAGEIVSDRWVRDPQWPGPPSRAESRVAKDDPAVAAVWKRLVRGDGAEESCDQELRSFIAEALTTHTQALRGLQAKPDLAMVYYQLTDQAGHLFEREMPPRQAGVAEDRYARYGGVVHGSYLLLDALLGELVAAAPGRDVIVISDHGFVYGLERRRAEHLRDPLSDLLHTPAGMYVMSGSFTPGEGPAIDIHDIAPTVLAVLGIPPASDMAGKVASVLTGTRPPDVPTHEVELKPPSFGLLSGAGCGASTAGGNSREALEKLEALGYIQGGGTNAGSVVWPLANLGRSLLDALRPVEASAALRLASARRPNDATIGQLLLEATLASGHTSAEEAEALARRWLRDEHGVLRGELAFPMVQLRLRQGDAAGAQALAGESDEISMGGVLTKLVVAMWTGEPAAVDRWFGKALQLDMLRAVDAIQGLTEVFPDRDLGIDALLARYADGLPINEIARSPASGLSGQPEPTLARARRASRESPSAVDRLWLRRAQSYRRRDGRVAP